MRERVAIAVAVAVTAAAFGIGGAGAASRPSRAPELKLTWLAPTPADGRVFTVALGTKLTVQLSASPGSVLDARGLPAGAALSSSGSDATLTWTPTAATLGSYAVVVTARSGATNLYTPPRTLFLNGVPAPATAAKPATTLLSSPTLSRWAYVYWPAKVRARPSLGSRVITKLPTETLDQTPNVVLVLASTRDATGRTWYHVRLPIRPNNRTGWVLWGAVGGLHAVRTYLVIDRRLLVATLYRSGHAVFQTRVGVGRTYWPTPTGDFYVREILTGFTDPMYGPVAFGTSARSSVLTDWHGGGGVIGIHGTDQPEILPGYVSHGCVRMANAAVSRLHRLMPLGTPVAIR
jgi:hypothetical protein